MKIVGTTLRLLLTAALLAVVWRHSHWSVALTLTLLTIVSEMRDWTTRLATRSLANLAKPAELERSIEQTVAESFRLQPKEISERRRG